MARSVRAAELTLHAARERVRRHEADRRSKRAEGGRAARRGVSVGAMKAAWYPASIAIAAACNATTVLPLPTSPCTRRCIGWGAARSAADFLGGRGAARPVSVNPVPASRRTGELAARGDRSQAGSRRIAVRCSLRRSEPLREQLLEREAPLGGMADRPRATAQARIGRRAVQRTASASVRPGQAELAHGSRQRQEVGQLSPSRGGGERLRGEVAQPALLHALGDRDRSA